MASYNWQGSTESVLDVVVQYLDTNEVGEEGEDFGGPQNP